MKTIYCLLVTFFLFSSTNFSQWFQQSSGTTQHLRSVDFINSSFGICVGNEGTILKTTNAGNNWQSKVSNTTLGLEHVDMVNENIGYAVGGYGTIIKTTDGGESWFSQISPDTTVLYSAFFIDEFNGWISTQIGNVLKTTDGGNNWTKIATSHSSRLESIFFTTSTNGFSVGTSGILLKTTNAGNTWEQIYVVISQGLYDVYFYNSAIGWSVGTDGLVLKTTDGGLNWAESYYPEPKHFLSVDFPTGSKGWLGGLENEILTSNNGGQTWDNSTSTVYEVHDLTFLSSTLGWAVGENGLILKFSDIEMLCVNHPNGGENWTVGEQQNILWNSSLVDDIKIEYSTDDGSTWLEVIDSIPSGTGSYQWSVPNTPSTQCKVKISDLSNPTLFDDSDGLFTISPAPNPLLTVVSPNGGENWQVGTIQEITWESSNVINVKIGYTPDYGTNWIIINPSTPSDGSYNWTVPNTPSTQCIVGISDVNDSLIYDISDNLFTISTPVTPIITVTQPNGGEIWQIGSVKNINWSSSNVIDVKIEFSINNGASWTEIISSTPSTGLYSWTVPNIPSLQCLIKISDVTDPIINDVSNNVFTIEQPSSIEDFYSSGVSGEFKLYQNFPNPFNPNTKIYYGVPEVSFVALDVYDVLGNRLINLVSEVKDAGYYNVEFDASKYNSGIYFYRLQAGSFVETKKMILMK